MTVAYVGVRLALHGLDAPDVQSVVDRLNAVLIPEFGTRFASDVEIEVEEHAGGEDTAAMTPMRIGDVLGDEDDSFCGGHFGRDGYGIKRVEMIGADWVVARNLDTQAPMFAACAPEQLVEYRA